MTKIYFSLALLLAFATAGCADVKTYDDYPWGDYSWEGTRHRHVDSNEAWDDFGQIFGRDQPRPPGG